MTTERPKTTALEAGRYYAPAFVGAIFGYTAEWARKQCRPGKKFPHATKLGGARNWLIPGADVLAVVGREQLELDRLAEAAAMPTPAEEKRDAEKALKELAKLKKAKRK